MITTTPTFAETDFRKATRSDPDRDCVHVARRNGWVEVRDTKKVFGAPDDHRMVFTAQQFDAFLKAVDVGAVSGHCIEITATADGRYRFRSTVAQPGHSTAMLEFTAGELQAFCDGVAKGEFSEEAFLVPAA